jgi:hypothetical protein
MVGKPVAEIAAHFEITPRKTRFLIRRYEQRIRSGEIIVADVDRAFWADVVKEAEGDVKVTFVSQKGFHHAWRSELRRLDGAALLSIYEASRDFLGADANRKFLEFPRPKGYDPLALDREVSKAVNVVSEILDEKWNEESERKNTLRNAHP